MSCKVDDGGLLAEPWVPNSFLGKSSTHSRLADVWAVGEALEAAAQEGAKMCEELHATVDMSLLPPKLHGQSSSHTPAAESPLPMNLIVAAYTLAYRMFLTFVGHPTCMQQQLSEEASKLMKRE